MRETADNGLNKPSEYVYLLLPDLDEAVEATRANWPVGEHPPDLSEIILFIGIILAMALDPILGPRSDYWKVEYDDENDFSAPRSYGKRYGMSRERFENIARYLRLASYTDKQVLFEV